MKNRIISMGVGDGSTESESLLKPAGYKHKGCYCKQGRCMAPTIMGRQTKCLNPERAAAQEEGK